MFHRTNPCDRLVTRATTDGLTASPWTAGRPTMTLKEKSKKEGLCPIQQR